MVSFFLFLCFFCEKFSLFCDLASGIVRIIAFLDYEVVTVDNLFYRTIYCWLCSLNSLYCSWLTFRCYLTCNHSVEEGLE